VDVLQETNMALFLVASLVLIATPGPDMIYVVTRGVAQGRRAALFSALGVLRWLTGSVLVGLGLSLALPERR
jgi:threonine/homoserine/homoserine lactone efflux protein